MAKEMLKNMSILGFYRHVWHALPCLSLYSQHVEYFSKKIVLPTVLRRINVVPLQP